MTKVKVTKEQAEIIEKVLGRYDNNKARAAMMFSPHKCLSIEQFTTCMIEGWEIERTKEDRVSELFNSYSNRGVAHKIIREMLAIMDMKVKGIND